TLVGNPNLRGEHIDTFELVADHRLGETTTLRASLYQWDMKHLIVLGLQPDSGLPQYQSGGNIRARGAELSMNRTWKPGVRLRSSLSLQDVSWGSGGDLVNSPNLLGRINLSGLLPWGGIRASYELRHDARRLTHDGTWLGGYTL